MSSSARVHRALSEILHAERVLDDNPEMFWVHSTSGERYAVDFADGDPFCTCEDCRGGFCKHIWNCLLIQPELLGLVLDGVDENEGNNPVTDGGQKLTTLEDGQRFEDKTGVLWEITKRVDQTNVAGEEVPCVRLTPTDGEGDRWIGCRKFVEAANDPDGEFVFVGEQ